MKKSVLLEVTLAAEKRIRAMRLTGAPIEEGQILADQEYLLNELKRFQLSSFFLSLKMDDNVYFVDFIDTIGGFFYVESEEPGFLEILCLDWMREEVWAYRENICLKHLILLDSKYYDAKKLLSRMQALCDSPMIDIFQHHNFCRPFSQKTIKILQIHPITQAFMSTRVTFLGTVLGDVPLGYRIFLDGKHEDATEILEFMKRQKQEGRCIFQNPASEKKSTFSRVSIETLAAHPITTNFVTEDRNELMQLAEEINQLPDEIYTHLKTYLETLILVERHKQSKEHLFFPAPLPQKYHNAKKIFMDGVRACSTEREINILFKAPLQAYLPNGSKEMVTFGRVFEDYDDRLHREVSLWIFLRNRHPRTVLPEELIDAFCDSADRERSRFLPGERSAAQPFRVIRIISIRRAPEHQPLLVANPEHVLPPHPGLSLIPLHDAEPIAAVRREIGLITNLLALSAILRPPGINRNPFTGPNSNEEDEDDDMGFSSRRPPSPPG